jgi:hypothetical protein
MNGDRWVELTSETLCTYVNPNSAAPLNTVPAASMYSCDLKSNQVTVHTQGDGTTQPAEAVMKAGSAAQAAEWAHELRSVQLERQLARLTPAKKAAEAEVVVEVEAVEEPRGEIQPASETWARMRSVSLKKHHQEQDEASEHDDDEPSQDSMQPPTPMAIPMGSPSTSRRHSNVLVGSVDSVSSSAHNRRTMFDEWKGAYEDMADRYVHTFFPHKRK